jgi:hypothetical protein
LRFVRATKQYVPDLPHRRDFLTCECSALFHGQFLRRAADRLKYSKSVVCAGAQAMYGNIATAVGEEKASRPLLHFNPIDHHVGVIS